MNISLNEEFINALAAKFGMFIDWTAENVYPQIMEILTRYRLYELTTNGIETVIGLILIITAIIFALKVFKETDNISYDDFPEGKAPHQTLAKKYTRWHTNFNNEIRFDNFKICGFITLGYSILALATGAVMFGLAIGPLIRWWFIPEIMFYQLIVG